MKIYTRTGDSGQTSLFGGGRVPKDDPRVQAYGGVDELNAVLGVAIATDPADFERPLLNEIQRDLFAIGGRLATPRPDRVTASMTKTTIPDDRIAQFEAAMDRAELELPPLKAFVLPTGTPKSAQLHHARTVCRRAERAVVTLARTAEVSPDTLVYLNRLSDLLFTLARLANHRADVPDQTW